LSNLQKQPLTTLRTGYDTLINNQIKEITLDSIPQGKYTLVCKSGNTEYKISFFIRKQELEVTKEQLKKVFADTDTVILAQIAATINAFSSSFGITTTYRMAHFLAQTGYEVVASKILKVKVLVIQVQIPMDGIFGLRKHGQNHHWHKLRYIIEYLRKR